MGYCPKVSKTSAWLKTPLNLRFFNVIFSCLMLFLVVIFNVIFSCLMLFLVVIFNVIFSCYL